MTFIINFAAAQPNFDNLIIGDNDEIMQSVKALIDGQLLLPSVFVWGEKGAGKSALLQAAAAYADDIDAPAYTVAAGGGLRSGVVALADSGTLLIDDVGALDAESEMNLFDWLSGADTDAPNRRRILATSDAAPARLPLREEVTTRLANGLVFKLRHLVADDAQSALASCARRRGLSLSDSVLELLMTHLPRDLESLTSVLDELDDFFMTQKKEVTPWRVKRWLRARAALAKLEGRALPQVE